MKTASDPRHQQRRKIIQELFAWQAHNQLSRPEDGKQLISSDRVKAIAKNIPLIDSVIKSCAPEWEINKINQVDLAILRLAVFELICDATEPSKAVIDEAIELAKEFGNETSPSFINGALGNCLTNPLRIKKLISNKLGVDEDRITPEATLDTDLNATALEISDLLAMFEKEYNFQLESGAKLSTVEDLTSYIQDQAV